MTDHDLAIDVTSLAKRFGRLIAVDGLSYSVAKDEMFGFLGPCCLESQ